MSIVDLKLDELPVFDCRAIEYAPNIAECEEPQNVQDETTWRNEADAIAAARRSIVWRSPSRHEMPDAASLPDSDEIFADAVVLSEQLPPTSEMARVSGAIRGSRERVVSSHFIDLVAGPGKDAMTVQPEGLPGAEMADRQKARLLALIDARLKIIMNAELRAAKIVEVRANLDQTYFAWFGPTEPPAAAYRRVTRPQIEEFCRPRSTVTCMILSNFAEHFDPRSSSGPDDAR
jgi:hypothetical protein